MQGVHKLDGGGAAAVIQESGQSLRLSWTKKFWRRESVWWLSPICAAQRNDLTRWNHSDRVDAYFHPNGRIKLRAKLKYEILSTTRVWQLLWYEQHRIKRGKLSCDQISCHCYNSPNHFVKDCTQEGGNLG